MCICVFVCVSDSAHALIGWLKINHPPTNRVFAFMYTNVKSLSLHGLHGRIALYLYGGYGIVVSVPACHAQDRRFDSRHSQYMHMAFSRRAMQRETIPDMKNVISQLKAIKLPFKSNTQRQKQINPQKYSFSVSQLGKWLECLASN